VQCAYIDNICAAAARVVVHSLRNEDTDY